VITCRRGACILTLEDDATDQGECKGVERGRTAVVIERQRVERWAEDVGCFLLEQGQPPSAPPP
jgi:hypothetical protein